MEAATSPGGVLTQLDNFCTKAIFKWKANTKTKYSATYRGAVSQTLCASRNPNFSNFALKTLQNLVSARTQLQVDRQILRWDSTAAPTITWSGGAHLANDGPALCIGEDYMQPAQQIRPNGYLSANFNRGSCAFKVAGRCNLRCGRQTSSIWLRNCLVVVAIYASNSNRIVNNVYEASENRLINSLDM